MPSPRLNIRTLMLAVLYSALTLGLAASIRSLIDRSLTTTAATTPTYHTTWRPLPAGR